MLVYLSTFMINERRRAIEIQEVAKDVVKRIDVRKNTMKKVFVTTSERVSGFLAAF